MTKNRLVSAFYLLLFFLTSHAAFAQKDTEFWFVAPEVTQGLNNYDRPVSFRISTYDAPAVVTLSQPANPGFAPLVLNLPANTSGQFPFPPFFDVLENMPANTVLNKGILITSTTPITAYYEVLSETTANPEIFSLKGRNALGSSFYIPMQNIMANSNAYLPLPHSSFDIVATENNTTVNITPTQAIVGHAAGVPFAITLNRGQTYSAQASSQSAAGHPTGSKVTSDKPIAITMKDDLLESGLEYGGFCRDLLGDQIVPVEKLGTQYIVQKGQLNTNEHTFVVGTQNGTQVLFDGVPAGMVNAGASLVLSVSGKHFIQTSAPVYVLQITGSNCEIGGEIMPSLDCSGSQSIRFVRPTNESFLLFLTTRTGTQGGFTLNGSGAFLPANAFTVVPGSNGAFVAATFSLSNLLVPTGTSSVVQNSLGRFQMGFLNGGVSTGCRYAFFSDFGNNVVVEETISFCSGSSVTTHGLTISSPGLYQATASNPLGCDTLFLIEATLNNTITTEQTITFCFGQSVTINGEVYTESGTVVDTLSTSDGCDSIITYTLTELPQYTNTSDISACPGDPVTVHGQVYFAPATIIDTLTALNGCDSIVTTNLLLQPYNTGTQNISFCPGDGVEIGGQFYTESATVVDTVPVTGACDSIITYHLTLLPQNTRSETITLCAGDSVTLGGQVYFDSGTVELTLPGITGCDTLVTYTLTVLPKPVRSEDISICAGQSVTLGGITYTESTEVTLTLPSSTACDTVVTYHLTVIPAVTKTENVSFCPGASVQINGENYSAAGTVVDTLTAASGCDSIVTYQLSLLPQPTRSETIKLCPGESVVLGGQTYTQPGTVTLVLPATTGCDTLVTYTIASELPSPSVVNIHCPANVSLIADPGTAPLAVNYTTPTADTDCPCPGMTVELTAGLPSGGLFPNGITQVCYKATDACGHSATCCFTVTVREIQPCDVKETPCVRYELLSITADPGQNLTYRIRVINNCANKLIYTAIQLPDGVVAMEPAQLSVYTAESGRKYDVRNPNFSPFYSIRFKSMADSISNGQSDIFQYTLPAQSAPLYMDITSRLATQVFYEAHLNTFYCPIGVTPTNGNRDIAATPASAERLLLFPNPSDGTLWVDLSQWSGQHPTWRIFNSQGQQVLQNTAAPQDDLLRIDLPQGLPTGLYFFEIQAEDGKQETLRFLLKS